MMRYFLNRLVQAIVTAAGVMALVFLLLRLTGDPTNILLPKEASVEQRAQFRHEMGFDRPPIVQFADYVAQVMRGDFGESYRYRLPVSMLIIERLPATLELALAGMFLAIIMAIPLGVLAAARPGSIYSALADAVGVIGLATPAFWAGLVGIIVFGVHLHMLPVAGRQGIRSLILPAFTMSLTVVGQLTRITRASMVDVLRQDYIRVAESKGLLKRSILFRHALRNASIPIVTLLGISLGYMLGGSVIIETVFSWPGIGWLTYLAVNQRDFVMVQGIVLFTSFVALFLTLLTDFLYGVLDPRIRLGRSSRA